MPGIDLAEFAERIRTLNAAEQGMNYRGAHSGERRYNEFDGKEYYTRGEPATLTVYGDRAQLLYDLIRNCAEIADALSTPVAQGDEVRDALERVLEALTPHGETKAAYMGEFSWTEWLPDENGVEQGHERTVPWTTIKEIMATIRDRAGVEKLDEADALATLTKGARDAG